MVGTEAEHAGIIKRGALMVSAVSCSKVPHISIIIGASYGAGNYAMCGRTYNPRFLFTWPSGRCAVMGPDQLSGVMDTVGGRRNGGEKSESAAKKAEERKQRLRDQVVKDSECYSTSAALHDDGVIDPRDTRDVLGICLEVVCGTPFEGSKSHLGYVTPSQMSNTYANILGYSNSGSLVCRDIYECCPWLCMTLHLMIFNYGRRFAAVICAPGMKAR